MDIIVYLYFVTQMLMHSKMLHKTQLNTQLYRMEKIIITNNQSHIHLLIRAFVPNLQNILYNIMKKEIEEINLNSKDCKS